jgi:hypothetical protein
MEKKDIRIVVGLRGWVHVGEYSRQGDQVRLDRAKCIRRWGTTKGLGEIAIGGPTNKTMFDEAGIVEVHAMAVVHSLVCDPEAWAKTLGL